MGSRNSKLSVDTADEMLRSRGLRRTYTRISILQCLDARTAPVTHAEMTVLLAPLGMDGSTIFRGLNDLAEAGLVCRLDPGDRVWRFELRDDPLTPDDSPRQHPHRFCSACGRIDCLTDQNGHPSGRDVSDWQVEQIVFVGKCPECTVCPANAASG
ncbi:Transcriptional regulator FurA [Maioricimonas rarisocia]|uniref:Transcriptional regulator FurA n=1 Tax=Maioricimonas rarisocia TaxID=2528026 RepID=A0A517Z6D8_9PLAN|nr:transcriptional repressor [Maioricimonas rarisocia]QDU37999.1 Transcriptional regulator FurA [Maioricimonas rarisocia]